MVPEDRLPRPFRSASQYEHSLRTPLGKEWVTSKTFARITRPDVHMRPGHVIKPIDKLAAAAAQEADARRKKRKRERAKRKL